MTARQLGFACDPAGAVVLVGDRVEVWCLDCGELVDGAFVVARTFGTGSIAVFNAAGRQRHLSYRRFVMPEDRGGGYSMKSHAIIHIAKKQLDMDDAAYRAMLSRVTGKASVADMSEAERGAVVVEMKRLGFKVSSAASRSKRKGSSKAYVRMIFALWRSIAEKGGIEDGSPAALKSFVEKRSGVADPEWLTYAQADPLIRALKAMEARAVEAQASVVQDKEQFKAPDAKPRADARRKRSGSLSS